MPRKRGSGPLLGTVAAKGSTTSARTTRRAVNKPELDKTPLENEVQEPDKNTPVTRVKKTAAFPDRLNWKMAHLRMPTTSTPKLDLTSRKVTERDVDTAFGFDDSCNDDVGANYSTIVSPIPHCSKGGGGPLGVWKVNPLTQRNVEIELPKPVSRSDRENIPERRSTRSKSKTHAPQKTNSNKIEATALSGSVKSKPKQTKEVTDAATILVSPTISEVPKDVVDLPESDVISIPEPEKADPQSQLRTQAAVSKSRSKTTKRPKMSAMPVGQRATRSRAKPKAQEATEPFTFTEAEVTKQKQLPTDVINTAVVSQSSSKLSNVTPAPSYSRLSPTTSATTRTRKVSQKSSSTIKSKAQPSSSNAKRRKKPLLKEDTDCGASPFSALLDKYSDDKPVSVELEGELHVDPKSIIRTYSSRKRVKFSEDREPECDFLPSTSVEFHSEPTKQEHSKRKPNSKKPARTKSKKEDELDEEAERWLEEKNKEFEEVLKVPLVIENSFSDSSEV